MARCLMRWGGLNAANVTCPLKYPKLAPQQQCGHISFVEMGAALHCSDCGVVAAAATAAIIAIRAGLCMHCMAVKCADLHLLIL
jgi:hypothetical protein